MKDKPNIIMIFALCLIWVIPLTATTCIAELLIVDHKAAQEFYNIPENWIEQAKNNLHIAYGHTSHGQQLIEGLRNLDEFMTSKGHAAGTYAVDFDGNISQGVLDLRDMPWRRQLGWTQYGRDLGSGYYDDHMVDQDYTAWVYTTRKYLGWIPGSGDGSQLSDYTTGTPNYGSDVNVVIWAWCGQVSYCPEAEIQNYLDNMSQLESDYPQVKFVYMTGHVNGTALTGNLHRRNGIIREYCRNNNKILYDFADIESYDPDGNYYGDKYVTQACNYDYNGDGQTSETAEASGQPSLPLNGDRNWALDWQDSYREGIDWYRCNLGYYHTQHLNHNLKAYATWSMMARLAGWDGVSSGESHSLTINVSGNGSVTRTPDKTSYTHGETVTLQALPNTGYSFTSWSGDLCGSSNPVVIVMDCDKLLNANFAITLRSNVWKVLPIRSQEEYNQGKIGGEAMQHPHSIARSPSNPDIIYFSQDCSQVWKSKDSGKTWMKPLGKGLFVRGGESIEVDPVNPNIVFLVAGNLWDFRAESVQGLYRSKDGGINWELVLQADTGFNSAGRMETHNIAYDPTSITSSRATRWYVALHNGALYRSEDSGNSWSNISDLSSHNRIRQIRIHPSDGQTIYLASDQGLFVSRSRGSNLQPLGNIPAGDVSSVVINPQNPSIIYATLVDDGLYRSTDAGETFERIVETNAVKVFMNPGYPNVLYLIKVWGKAMVSCDGGNSWIENTAIPAPGLERTWQGRIEGGLTGVAPHPNNPDEAVAFSRATLWKTTDGGQTFVDSATLYTGFAVWVSNGFAFNRNGPNNLALFACDVGPVITENGGDYFERRGWGQIWEFYEQGLVPWTGSNSGDFHPTDPQTIVASVGYYHSTKIMRSTDGGDNWSLDSDSDLARNSFVAFNPNDPSIVYAEKTISHDGGQTFDPINFGEYSSRNPELIGMCRSNGDVVYAVAGRYIYRSNDKGSTWYLYADPPFDFGHLDSIPTFAVDPVDCNKLYAVQGNTWVLDPKPLDLVIYDGSKWRGTGVIDLTGGTEIGNFVRMIAIDPRHPEIIYAGTYTPGLPCVFRSEDGGYTWQDITDNLPRSGLAGIAVSPHTGELFAGGAFGTWVCPPPYESENLIYDKCVSYDEISSPSNKRPLANAGQDQIITDKDKDGREQVTLDGSSSKDPDGTIVGYVWSEDGLEIANGKNPTVILSTGTHSIKLSVTDNEGLTDTDRVSIKVLTGDEEFGELPAGCYNNVFNPAKGERALIVVELPKQGRVRIVLYNTRGNKIKELLNEEKETGTHRYYWDGRDDSGNVVGSGLYFVHIQAGDYKKIKKIVVVK